MGRYLVLGLVVTAIVLMLASRAFCLEDGVGAVAGPPIDNYDNPPMYSELPDLGEKAYTADAPVGVIKARNRDNGIVVGQPKLFELRSLQVMIDNVKRSLAQTSFPDTSQLFGMTGRVQGLQSTSSAQATEVVVPTGYHNADGSIPQPAVPRGITPSFSSDSDSRSGLALSASDVLAEQTSLWHQLVNLQMLMDGALSDRLIPVDRNGAATGFNDAAKLSPRAQAVIGFQISVDPREEYRNAVAEAVITIDNKEVSVFSLGGYGDEPSLMMLLPQNRTYNTVSINRDSKSFGFGTVVNVLSLGSSQEKRRETFYIGKDTDTVALERIPGLPAYGLEKNSSSQTSRYRGVSFGWQFRPVFNRPAVEPGVRQVFAMLSLPASLSEQKWEGRVSIMTYWRRYDRSTGAVGKPIRETVNEWALDDIVVPIGSGVEEALRPCVSKIQWEDAGSGNAAVTVEGSNFSLGTDIACGEAVLDEKSLSLLDAKRIRFVVPASTVARGDITLIGRYGVANLRQSAADNDDPYKGIEVSAPRLAQQDDQTTSVELTLSKVQNPARLASERCPVVQLDGQLFGVGDKPFSSMSADELQKTVTIRFFAPTQMLAKTRELVVRDLVGPAAISVALGTDEGSCIANKAVVLSTGNTVSVAVLGSGFRDDVRVQVGSSVVTDLRLNSSDGRATVMTFEIDKETAANTKYILITQGKQSPLLVPFAMPASSAVTQ
ncbi:MAG TPA: hypothetical protein VGK34_05605 [Armatimonadota bacterium]|jgi:hypothetical protein